MTTNPPPDARNARIHVATANVAIMDILSGGEQLRAPGIDSHTTPAPAPAECTQPPPISRRPDGPAGVETAHAPERGRPGRQNARH